MKVIHFKDNNLQKTHTYIYIKKWKCGVGFSSAAKVSGLSINKNLN